MTLGAKKTTAATFFSRVRYVTPSALGKNIAAAKRAAENREHLTPTSTPGATLQLVGLEISDSRLVCDVLLFPSTVQMSMLDVNVEYAAVSAHVHVLGVDVLDPMAEKRLTKTASVGPVEMR